MRCSEAIISAETILINQQKRIIAFDKKGNKDPLYWFCKAYSIVTAEQLAFIKNGRFHYPCFAARMIAGFDKIFEDNLYAFLQGKEIPSLHWKKVFRRLYSSQNYDYPFYQFMKSWTALERCLKVHIQKDLPLCLAAVIEKYYKDEDADAFDLLEADYFSMTKIFHFTAKKMEQEILQEFNLHRMGMPALFRRQMLKWYIDYVVIRNRKRSWHLAKQAIYADKGHVKIQMLSE